MSGPVVAGTVASPSTHSTPFFLQTNGPVSIFSGFSSSAFDAFSIGWPWTVRAHHLPCIIAMYQQRKIKKTTLSHHLS
jgi:hypothetical protein